MPFSRKSLLSGAAFFAFGAIGVLPVLSQRDLGMSVPEDAGVHMEETEETSGRSIEEGCRWQADVRLLASARDGRSDAIRTEVPCEQKSAAAPETSAIIPDRSDAALADAIRELTAGHPLEAMALAIAKYDRGVAGLIVGIAKKESNWGKRVPLDANGDDCFNYWGYKGAGSRGVAMGHGCFGSKEEAVAAVGDRLKELVALRETSEPARMIIWKCGSSCKGHSDESVQKWITDVSIYYDRIALR